MRKRFTFVLLVVVVSLAGRLAGRSSILPPPPGTQVTLLWNYPYPMDQLVFNVYQNTNLTVNQWSLVTNLTTTSCILPVIQGPHFFTVSVSNTVTGLESFIQ